MPLQCNLDAKEKRVRLIGGIITLVVALVFVVLAATGVAGTWAWYVATGSAVGAAFQLFEARAGWCAFKAMGSKRST
ncbi:MAG: hypothetical protein ACOC1G_08495 [Phycisphaeraceae bacterium]